MKTTLTLLLALFAFSGCQKYIEQKQEEAAISIVTSGQWKVTLFTKGSTDKTSLFTPYLFQFQPNETVDAIRNGAVEATGTWKVSIPDHTIISGFSAPAEPLQLLSGVYRITNSTTTTVDASQTVNGELWTLHLVKQ